MGTYQFVLRQFAVVATLAAGVACGGGGYNPGGPSGGGGSGGPGPVGATITIGSDRTVSPSSVTISVGQSVTFVNNDNRAHEMTSDPHPAHTDCPALNGAAIAAGQSRTTNALTAARTCGFHDHLDDTNPNLRGTIVVR